jgi:hypothetical protein
MPLIATANPHDERYQSRFSLPRKGVDTAVGKNRTLSERFGTLFVESPDGSVGRRFGTFQAAATLSLRRGWCTERRSRSRTLHQISFAFFRISSWTAKTVQKETTGTARMPTEFRCRVSSGLGSEHSVSTKTVADSTSILDLVSSRRFYLYPSRIQTRRITRITPPIPMPPRGP